MCRTLRAVAVYLPIWTGGAEGRGDVTKRAFRPFAAGLVEPRPRLTLPGTLRVVASLIVATSCFVGTGCPTASSEGPPDPGRAPGPAAAEILEGGQRPVSRGSGPKRVAIEPREFPVALNEIACIGVSPDQSCIAVAGVNQNNHAVVNLIDIKTGREIKSFAESTTTSQKVPGRAEDAQPARQDARVPGQDVGTPGQRGAKSQPLERGALSPGRSTAPYQRAQKIFGLRFSPDGKRLAVVGAKPHLFSLWDIATGKRLTTAVSDHKRPFGPPFELKVVEFSPDGKLLMVGDNTGLWDMERDALKWQRNFRTGGVAFTPDGTGVVTAEYSNRVHLWDTKTGQQLAEVHGEMGILKSVAFHPNGKTVAVGGGGARLWDIVRTPDGYTFKDRQRLPWQYPYGDAKSVAFAADGKLLVTVGNDLARVWDVADNRLMTTADRNACHAVVSPDGQSLIVAKYHAVPRGRGDAYVRILDLNSAIRPETISREVLEAVEEIVNYSKDPAGVVSQARFQHAMRSLGPHAGVGASRLTKALAEPSRRTREHAMQALTIIGPPAAKVAVPQLTELLLDEFPGIRQMAAMTLRQITPETADSVVRQAQQKLAQNPHQPELRDGIWTYEGLSLTQWLQMAGDRNDWLALPIGQPMKRRSEKGIEMIGEAAIPAIRKELNNPDWQTRAGAAGALTVFDATRAEGIEALTAVMIDGPDRVAWSAAGWLTRALQRTNTKPPRQLETLLESDNVIRQAQALNIILRVDPQHERSQQVIKKNVMDLAEQGGSGRASDRSRVDRCEQAISLLEKVGQDAAFATPELIALVASERNQTGWNFSERLRATAIKTLGQVGPAARDATPTLIKMLKHRDLDVRAESARALPQVVSGDVPEQVIAMTRLSDGKHLLAAMWTLRRFGTRAVPHLRSLLNDHTGVTVFARQEALQALANMVNDGVRVPTSDLVSIYKEVAANDPDETIRKYANMLIKSAQQPQRPVSPQAGPPIAADGANEATQGDSDRFQGTWKVLSIQDSGEKPSPDAIKNLTMVITKDRIDVKDGDKTLTEMFYKLNPTKKPKWIDLAEVRGGKKLDPNLGIYELEDDNLKICFAESKEGERSTAFESKPNSANDVLIILNRKKP